MNKIIEYLRANHIISIEITSDNSELVITEARDFFNEIALTKVGVMQLIKELSDIAEEMI